MTPWRILHAVLGAVWLVWAAIPARAQPAPDPAAAWTDQRRSAVVHVRTPENQGTGFVVRSDSGEFFVITAAHVLFGPTRIDPSRPPPPGAPDAPVVPRGAWQPIDPQAVTLKQGGLGGLPLEAAELAYLGGPDIAALRLRNPGRAVEGLRLGWFHVTRHAQLATIGFRAGLDLQTTPVLAQHDGIGPNGATLFRATSAEGLSGAPYLSADGLVIGVHSGVLTVAGRERPGFVAVMPFYAVEDALRAIGIRLAEEAGPTADPPAPPPPGKPSPVFAARVRVQMREPAGSPPPALRAPNPGEVEVVLRRDQAEPARDLVQSPDGTLVLRCAACSTPGAYLLDAVHITTDARPYRPQPVSLDMPRAYDPDEAIILALTHPQRVGATVLAGIPALYDALFAAPTTPACFRSTIPALLVDCRIAVEQATPPPVAFMAAASDIRRRFEEALDYGSEAQLPDARRRFGNFLTRVGHPCDAEPHMRQAALSPSLTGTQASTGWADAITACMRDKTQATPPDDPPAHVLVQLSEIVAAQRETLGKLPAPGAFARLGAAQFRRLGNNDTARAGRVLAERDDLRKVFAGLLTGLYAPACRLGSGPVFRQPRMPDLSVADAAPSAATLQVWIPFLVLAAEQGRCGG